MLAGCVLVPFHGDESTTLYESRDFTTFFLNGDLAHLIYRVPPPTDDPEAATRQELRILNGVLSGYIYGAMAHLAGFTTADLNQQWDWGADWAYNHTNHAYPETPLLFVTRWTSALLTALSVTLIFGAGYKIGGRWTAYLAALVYTLTPAVLLNGRRAVFEGSLLLTEALLLYVTIRIVGKRPSFKGILALGAASGLALLSKHTNALIIAAAFLALIAYPVIQRRWRSVFATVGMLIPAGLLTAIIFFAFNPSWWGTPLTMPQIVLAKRQAIIGGQADPVQTPHALVQPAQQLDALLRESLLAPPQYFESDQPWSIWIGDQIARYEASGLAGPSGSVWSIIMAGLLIVGVLVSLYRWQRAPPLVLLIWLIVTVLGLYVLNPLDWQRYYLPLAAPVALLTGQSTGLFRWLWRRSTMNHISRLPSVHSI